MKSAATLCATAICAVVAIGTSCATPSSRATAGAIGNLPTAQSSTATSPTESSLPTAAPQTLSPETGVTFQEAPGSTQTSTSAQAAWAKFQSEGVNDDGTTPSSAEIPPDINVSLGYFSQPLDSSQDPQQTVYKIKDALTWAYTYNTGCVSTLPNATDPPAQCKRWIFLSADDGHFVFATYEKI